MYFILFIVIVAWSIGSAYGIYSLIGVGDSANTFCYWDKRTCNWDKNIKHFITFVIKPQLQIYIKTKDRLNALGKIILLTLITVLILPFNFITFLVLISNILLKFIIKIFFVVFAPRKR